MIEGGARNRGLRLRHSTYPTQTSSLQHEGPIFGDAEKDVDDLLRQLVSSRGDIVDGDIKKGWCK